MVWISAKQEKKSHYSNGEPTTDRHTIYYIWFLRAVNPIGGAYKVESYLNAAGLHFFLPASLILTILFAAWEFALGVCTLLGTNIRSTSLFMIVMMAFYYHLAYITPILFPYKTTTVLVM